MLVVGAGPTGQQLAAELRRAGRHVVLAVGPPRAHAAHLSRARRLRVAARDRPARRPCATTSRTSRRRGALRASRSAAPPAASRSGWTASAALGVVVTGRLTGFTGRHALFARRPAARAARCRPAPAPRARADRRAHRAHSSRAPRRPHDTGAGVARSRAARRRASAATSARCSGRPATGAPTLARGARPRRHRRARPPGRRDCRAPGLFALGLRFQRTRKSHFLGGVGRRRGADRRAHRRRRWRCPAAEGRMSAAGPCPLGPQGFRGRSSRSRADADGMGLTRGCVTLGSARVSELLGARGDRHQRRGARWHVQLERAEVPCETLAGACREACRRTWRRRSRGRPGSRCALRSPTARPGARRARGRPPGTRRTTVSVWRVSLLMTTTRRVPTGSIVAQVLSFAVCGFGPVAAAARRAGSRGRRAACRRRAGGPARRSGPCAPRSRPGRRARR